MRTSVRKALGQPCRGSVCWLLAVLALPALAAAQPYGPVGLDPGQAARDGSADQRYIVTFRSSPGEKSADEKKAEAQALVAAGRRSVRNSGGRVLRELPSVTAVAAWLPEEALQELRRDPDVERIEVDARRYLLQSGPPWRDTSQGGEITPFGIPMIQADQLSDAGAGSRKVCIIDTGYYRGHDDLQSAHVTASPDPATGDPFVDPHGHGTHVAGTIAAVGGNGIGVRGLNPSQRINLHIIKAFGRYGNWAYSSDVVHALARCREAGAHVVSMSFGGPELVAAEELAFAEAYAAGVLLVAAAGNSANSSYSYPASYFPVISVAAVDANENVAAFSQTNDKVELAAPGVAVLSTLPPPHGYAAWSGTSMATPHVAGAAALIWSYNPSWTNGDIRWALRQTAKDKGPAGRDWSFGYGIVQAKAALDYLCGFGCVPPPPPVEPASGCLTDTGQGDFETGRSAGVDVTATGEVRLSPHFTERSESVSTAGVDFSTTTWRAQTFTAGVTGYVTAADLWVSCERCNGLVPSIYVSVRKTSGGVPVGEDLAYGGIQSSLGAGWRTVEFASPMYVEAGRQYALVARAFPEDAWSGSYFWRTGEADTYAGGQPFVSTNGGSTWSSQGGPDLSFRAYLTAVDGPYATSSGWLESSVLDSLAPQGATVQWDTLSWNATLPAGASIRFQVAGSDSAAGPFEFVGPDGTAGSFFTTSGVPVSRFGRYLRYRVELTTIDSRVSPVLHDVTACYTTIRGADTILRGRVTDAVSGDPIAGAAVAAGAYSATTDASGRFEIVNVAPGTYSVTASASGYAGGALSNVTVRSGFTTSRDLALHPLAGCVTDTTLVHFQAGAGSDVDATSAPGEVRLAFLGGELDQSQSDRSGGLFLSTTERRVAQTFTAAKSGFLRRLEIEFDCDACSGADPDITVEIRDAVGGVPGNTVLAAATIAGFSSPATTYYTASFLAPPALASGTQYSFVLRLQQGRAAGQYVVHASNAQDSYGGGVAHLSFDGGSNWFPQASDLVFRTYVQPEPGVYVPSGALKSAAKDGGPAVRWTTLSWTSTTPASTAMRFQVAVAHSASGPFNFVGPDGSAGTFFTASGTSLALLPSGRFAKYKLFLSSSDTFVTPALRDATLCFERLADTTPPSAPGAITSSHDGGSPLADPTIEIAWGPAVDTPSGVDGYSYSFDHNPVSLCETTKDVEAVTLQATSPALADGTWYVHVCAVDRAGNWGAAAHGGPYRVVSPCLTDTTLAHFQAGIASNVSLTATPGDVQLAFLGGGGAVDQSQPSPGDEGWRISSSVWEGQTFTPGTNGLLTGLDINLWCWICAGNEPDVLVEVRDVIGSAPGQTVLAAAKVPGFVSATPTDYSVSFSSPPYLTAGIQYAIVVRLLTERAFGVYATNLSQGDAYGPGAHRFSTDGGASWGWTTRDLAFRTYMAPSRFMAAGTLESSVKDAGFWPARWTGLSWLRTSPASTGVQFQVAASDSASGPFNFVGPDGTAGTFFTTSGPLARPGLGRYLKYRAFLSTGNTAVTPAVHDVTVCSAVPQPIFADDLESGDASAWSLRRP